jgi:predicted nucleic acid-binding protein
MSFLSHLDVCAAYARKVPSVINRFVQYRGQMHISALTIMGLELWLLHKGTPVRYMQAYAAIMRQLAVLDVNEAIAHRGAVLGSQLSGQGRRMSTIDLLVAATALVHNLTRMAHNMQDFANVPGLAVVDWLVP